MKNSNSTLPGRAAPPAQSELEMHSKYDITTKINVFVSETVPYIQRCEGVGCYANTFSYLLNCVLHTG